MIRLRRLFAKLVGHLRNSRVDAEASREIAAHLSLLEEDFRAKGMAEGEARVAARRICGNPEQIRQSHRNERSILWLEQMRQNVRFSSRQLRKSPGFTIVAVLTLALGIGAVTSVFSVVNGVLLKPFAFREPGRLVVIREVENETRSKLSAIPDNYRHFIRLRQSATTLEGAAIFEQGAETLSSSGDHPRMVGAVESSPNLFRVLGVGPILGRDFADSDAAKGAGKVILLSYDGWQQLFQGNPKVIGQTMRLGDTPRTIIGVLPPGIRFPQIALSPNIPFQEFGGAREPIVFTPYLPNDRDLTNDQGNYNFKVIARLKSGVTFQQARAELDGLQHAYSLSAHLPVHLGIAVSPLASDVTYAISGALWLLLAAVGAVLLIGCVNLANLQMARTTAAMRETAVRAALGAGAAQLVMVRLTESLVLAVLGGAGGIALAFAGVRLLVALVPANVPRLEEVHVNWIVLLFAAGLSTLSAILFGILPALRSLGVSPQSVLQANSTRAANSREGRHTRAILVASEVACTVVLLIVTSLVLRSFSRLLHQDRGFDSTHVTAAQVDLFTPKYSDDHPDVRARKLSIADRALATLQHLPGVESVALTSAMPLTGETWVDELVRPDHPLPPAERPAINVRWINVDYMATMRVPLIAGRAISASDRNNPYVALISERTAREGFPGEDPVGKTIVGSIPDDLHRVTIIGVVADTRINGLKDSAPMVYMPYWDFTPWTLSFLVRSSQPGSALISEIRAAIWSVDPQVAIPTIKAMDDQLSDSVASDRFQVEVLSAFAASALLLALMGVYGVLAYSVSMRSQEFGIRIALGSKKAALTALVLRQAAWPVLSGTAVGLILSFVVIRWIHSLLYQAPVVDPVAIGVSVLAIIAVALVAAVLPARHAAGVNPVQALRVD
jgi:putative ABC transport system permease protein